MSKVPVKKYHWLKLNKDFFFEPKIKKLRRIAGGDTYVIILQKIMLTSISDGGLLYLNGIEDSLSKELALIMDEDDSNVEITLNFMRSFGLLEEISDKKYLLTLVPKLIGSEGDSAERMRRLRGKSKEINKLTSHCDAEVTESDTDVEKELEKELGAKACTHEVLTLEKIAIHYSITPETLEKYIYYRLGSGNIRSTIALSKSILQDLTLHGSIESLQLVDWLFHMQHSSSLIDSIASDFASLASIDRKICREMAKDYSIKISDTLIEIAYQRSLEFRGGRNVR